MKPKIDKIIVLIDIWYVFVKFKCSQYIYIVHDSMIINQPTNLTKCTWNDIMIYDV
jgi:hypothetical protein